MIKLKFLKKIRSRPARTALLAGLFLCTLLTVYIDVVIGYIPDLTVLYLIPVITAVITVGLRWGVIMACFATAAELLADYGFGILNEPGVILNSILHLAVFLIVAFLINRLVVTLRNMAELERKRELELLIAKKLHDNIFAPFPERIGSLSVGGKASSASELGGDYYLFYEKNSSLFFCIGDIAGKGIASALFSSMLHQSVTDALKKTDSLEEIVKRINHRMISSLPDGMFVTLFACTIGEDAIEFVNAGHEPPLIYRAATGKIESLERPASPPAGVLDVLHTETCREPFREGDLLVCFTDGISESPEFRYDAFSRLSEILLANSDREPQEIAELIYGRALRNGEIPQKDDIIIACIRRD
ncbi:MAG: PP2C family protein-serine/threonine phosphatase [Candidatus Xenobiia bacterium LiM19]